MSMTITDFDRWPVPQSDYEAEALAFCQSWRSGQTTFTLHTSGSTGTPKPITLTRTQMQASAQLTGKTLGLAPGDAALVCLNIRYVAGVMMLVRGLELGLPMTIVEPSSDPLAAFALSDTHFAFTALVPLQLQTILATTDAESLSGKLARMNRMKAILIGGAATSPALETALQVISAPVYATYGMTETVSHIALRRLNGPQASGLFTALEGVELGTDDRGCLHITSAATNFERVQTNDVVELVTSEPGTVRFRLLGRADMVINSGGVKVQPEQVERIIQDVLTPESVTRLFVAGLPDERLGQRVVLICEQRLFATAEFKAMQEAVRLRVGPFAVPKEQIAVASFSETPTGKIDRKATMAQIR